MLLTEPLERINYELERDFGKQIDDRPSWRVVWSEDQTEKRWMDKTDEGFDLLYPEVRLVKKYQHIQERYVLEHLVPIPPNMQTDLVANASYEPIWTFEDRHRNYLPPSLDACKMIIEAIYASMQQKNAFTKYKDDTATPEANQKKLQDMEEKLFGNETPVTDALAYGYGVAGFHEKEAQ